MLVKYRKAVPNDIEEICRIVQNAVDVMERDNIFQWDDLYPAKSTLLHIERQLREIDIHVIRLDVFSNNPFALKLYDSLGYSKVGHADWRKGKFFLMEKCF